MREAGSEGWKASPRVRAASIVALLAGAALAALLLRGSGPTSEPAPEVPLDALRMLGYVEEVAEDPEPTRDGVIFHDPDHAWQGVNIYCSVRARWIRFLDMAGKELHRIRLRGRGRGSDCQATPDGDGILVLTDPLIRRLGARGEVLFRSAGDHHHDLHAASTGEILTLSRRTTELTYQGRVLPIWDDGITVLDRAGGPPRTLWLSTLFADRISAGTLAHAAMQMDRRAQQGQEVGPLDLFHANGVERVETLLDMAKPGHVLVSIRELDLVAIVDLDTPEVLWSWGKGELDRPHHPTLLPNGHILVFDNGWHRGWSRVLEVDPVTRKIVWVHRATPPTDFFSKLRGSVEPLPNGNRLITESTRGRVFEVTRDGRIVWDFRNPDRLGKAGARRQIYRMGRMSLETFERLIESREPAEQDER
jgi:hypothetical protein